MKYVLKFIFLIVLLFWGTSYCYAQENQPVFLRGVNLGAAGFAPHMIPGKHGYNYLWPSPKDVDLYADMGASVLRIPFLWERMQRKLMGSLEVSELRRLDAIVSAGKKHNIIILLDVHNYASYNKQKIGSKDVPVEAFVDLWKRLATHYKNTPNVAFGLMNEPYRHDAETWAGIAQEAVLAIRDVGAKQLILVPGTFWSGAHAWFNKVGKLSNAEALATIKDPDNNFAYEIHGYFDKDSSGTHPECVSEDIGVERLRPVTEWLKQRKIKGFYAEFGASKNPICLKALEKALKHMDDHRDAWLGWTYWAAAAWFGNYMFNVYPPDPARYPQIDVLKRFMKD